MIFFEKNNNFDIHGLYKNISASKLRLAERPMFAGITSMYYSTCYVSFDNLHVGMYLKGASNTITLYNCNFYHNIIQKYKLIKKKLAIRFISFFFIH